MLLNLSKSIYTKTEWKSTIKFVAISNLIFGINFKVSVLGVPSTSLVKIAIISSASSLLYLREHFCCFCKNLKQSSQQCGSPFWIKHISFSFSPLKNNLYFHFLISSWKWKKFSKLSWNPGKFILLKFILFSSNLHLKYE